MKRRWAQWASMVCVMPPNRRSAEGRASSGVMPRRTYSSVAAAMCASISARRVWRVRPDDVPAAGTLVVLGQLFTVVIAEVTPYSIFRDCT